MGNDGRSVWVSSYPYAEYVRHAWAGAWVNTLFRNESDERASYLIRDAVAATLTKWPAPPLGMVTFVDSRKVPPSRARRHRCKIACGQTIVFGLCYSIAGFSHVGFTKAGLWAWQMLPEWMPAPMLPNDQLEVSKMAKVKTKAIQIGIAMHAALNERIARLAMADGKTRVTLRDLIEDAVRRAYPDLVEQAGDDGVLQLDANESAAEFNRLLGAAFSGIDLSTIMGAVAGSYGQRVLLSDIAAAVRSGQATGSTLDELVRSFEQSTHGFNRTERA